MDEQNPNSYLASLYPQNAESSPALSTDDVVSNDLYMSPQEVDAYNQYQQMSNHPAIGAQSPYTYYPDVHNNINVGNSSGSIIGSQTLFAPGGGLIPLGLMDARDKALMHASLQKQKEVEDFRKQFKAPTSKLTNINEGLTDEYFNYINSTWKSALKRAGGDPNRATAMLKNNPDFWAKEKSFQDLAKRGDAVVGKLAEIQSAMKDDKHIVSPALREAQQRVQEYMNPSSDNFKNLSSAIMKMDADLEFGKVAEDMLKGLVSSKTGRAYDRSNPDAFVVSKEEIESLSPEAIKSGLDNLQKIYAGSSLYSPSYIEDNWKGMANWKKTSRDLNISSRPKDESPTLVLSPMTNERNVVNGKVLQTKSPSVPIIDPKTNKQRVDADGKPMFKESAPNYRDARYSVYDQATFDKPIKTVIPLSAIASDLSEGKPVEENGNVSVEIGGVGNALVFRAPNEGSKQFENMMIDDDAQDVVKKNGVYEPVVPVKYTTVDEDGAKVQKSEWVPLHTVENALRGKGGANDKALQEIRARAQQRTIEHQKKVSAPKQSKGQSKIEDLRKKYNY